MRRWGTRLLRSIAVALLVMTSMAVPPSPASAQKVAAGRVMVVGDSISQGLEGDYTWRYRIAEHFARTGATVDFVGPWGGTHVVQAEYPPGWQDGASNPPVRDGAYRPGISFDSEHLTQWGWSMRAAKDVIAGQVAAHKPQYLLVELGFNDIAWGINNPRSLIEDLRWFIFNARSAKPDLRIVVGNVVQRTPLAALPALPAAIAEYNNLLFREVMAVNNPTSPVLLADIDGLYDENRDTWDGLHPNTRGELVIAKAFADPLAQWLGLGGAYGALPAAGPPELPVGAPAAISATPVGENVRVSWRHVFGAAGYLLYQRNATRGEPFKALPLPIGADSWLVELVPAGHRVEFYVRTVRGERNQSGNSAVAGATGAPLGAVPNVRVTADPDRPYTATVSWSPVPGARDYSVYAAPGCDNLPPAADKFKIQQYGLGTATSWTQSYVLDDCMNYKVVATRWGGEGPMPFAGVRVLPYQNNQYFGFARSRYLDAAPDVGDRKSVVFTAPGRDRGIVVARGFIDNTDAVAEAIGDRRSFSSHPYSSAKIGFAWDTRTGEVGFYTHRSCVLLNGPLPIPGIEAGCWDALPVVVVENAGLFNDNDYSAKNYVSTWREGDGLIVTVSVMNAVSGNLVVPPFGRINARVRLIPEGDSFRSELVSDKFPSWEIYRYPRTAPLGGDRPDVRTIGTRGQTNILDLRFGSTSACFSRQPERVGFGDHPMACRELSAP